MKTSKLLAAARRALELAADPAKAPLMQAYMKSEMPYHGVQSPGVKAIQRALFKDLEFDAFDSWQREVLAMWRGAKFREERYIALGLCELRAARAFQTPQALPLYEELIVTGAWWDYVDPIASRMVGPIVKRYPKLEKTMLRWSVDKNMWKRRVAILYQLAWGADTDLEMLYACIEPSLASKEFFLQKAIGWALRQVAWRDPGEVKRYVRENETRLAPLSKREALKNL